MRLLDTHTLKLTSFFNNIPPYAILSHCWEEEEVILPDLDDLEKARTKKGFRKIEKSCAQAIKDGFDYCWVDTCCIDKSSSAELSEAINSMFDWYKASSKCYAYLTDVEGPEDFEKSKWFTRAWTLQELLAPKSGMKFYTRDWRLLGIKAGLSATISTVTSIPQEYFQGMSLTRASISMRMSWAADRQATRAEDIAYSLLGLFDVNMPLLYGEGKVKAFRRLQEEIMKISEDETIFAWDSVESVPDASSTSALARDPKDFWESRHLIPFPSSGPNMPYTMTHRGLRIWLLVFTAGVPGDVTIQNNRRFVKPLRSPIMIWKSRDSELLWGVLRCHAAHDFYNAIVIPLRRLAADVYRRDCNTSVALFPNDRIPGREKAEEVYIGNSSTTAISKSLQRRYGFLIRNLPPGFSIARVVPTDFWFPKDKILQGDKDASGREFWYATMQLNLPSATFPEHTSVLLTIACVPTNRSVHPDVWVTVDDKFKWEDPNVSQAVHQRELESYHLEHEPKKALPKPTQFTDVNGKTYDFRLYTECPMQGIMGVWMYCFDMKVLETQNKRGVAVREK